MDRKTLQRIAPITLFLSLQACDKGTEPAKTDSAESEGKESNVPKADDGTPSKADDAKQPTAPGLPNPCTLVDEAVLRAQLGLAEDAKLDVGDKLDAGRVNDDAKSCTWSFDGQMIGLQVTVEPSGNKFDTWASRMLEAKKAEGFEAVQGLADGGVFRAKDSHLMFRQGESRLFSLSYAGDRPGATLELDKLKPIGASVVKP
ncbi:MAG: hypothetical protein ACRBN8_30780 [Nannocystales bacterium]